MYDKNSLDWFEKNSDQVYHYKRWKLNWRCTFSNFFGIQFLVDINEIMDINFLFQIPNIISLIEHWKRKKFLLLLAKLLKGWLIPKLNHLFISLPSPKREALLYLYKCIFEFICKSKVDKVKRAVITQDYFAVGMKMVDINNCITSLRCSGIKMLTKSYTPWMDIFFYHQWT